MLIRHLFSCSDDLIEVFNKVKYEKMVLEIMNQSQVVFPSSYKAIDSQSNGECDFVDLKSGEKYDAKLPFKGYQIEMLTDGKKHKPEIVKWLLMMHEEAASFNPLEYRENPNDYIESTILYGIMKEQIEKDKEDENIVFFLPYPITLCVKNSVFLQFASDYLNIIYKHLKNKINLRNRRLFAIYPADEKNHFVLRGLDSYLKEYIQYDGAEKYFSYEIIDVSVGDLY